MKLFMQQWNNELSMERNQIVFENRNKAYGAFALRQAYNENMIKAFFGTFLFLGFILLIPAFYGGSKIEIPGPIVKDDGPIVILEELKIKQTIESPAQTPAKIEKVVDKLNVKISNKEDNREKLDEITSKPIEAINTVNNSNLINTDNNNGTNTIGKPETKPTTKEEVIEVKPLVEQSPVTWAPVMPLFPGGDIARKKFFSDKMVYPRIPLENVIEGTVIVNFIVGLNGEIRDVKIVKSVNKDLDKEAMRVISLMPNWTPGMNNGKPVKVSFNLPVKFVIPN